MYAPDKSERVFCQNMVRCPGLAHFVLKEMLLRTDLNIDQLDEDILFLV